MTIHRPGVGLTTATDSSASPSAAWAIWTHVPDVQLKRCRSRSAPASAGLPMRAESWDVIGVTITWCCWLAPSAMVGLRTMVEARGPPWAWAVTGGPRLVTV
jgi:hypothetical protein